MKNLKRILSLEKASLVTTLTTQDNDGLNSSSKSHWHSLPIEWKRRIKRERPQKRTTSEEKNLWTYNQKRRKTLERGEPPESFADHAMFMHHSEQKAFPLFIDDVNIQISLLFEGSSIGHVKLSQKFMFSLSEPGTLLMKQTDTQELNH